jgi:hypothetical protein
MSRTSTKTETNQSATQSLRLPVATPEQKPKLARNGFSMSELALPQDFDTAIGLETHVHTVAVKKPGKLTFVRVHPSPEYRMAVAILIDDMKEAYAVHPQVLHAVADEAKPMMLYTAVDEMGNAFLLPVGLPGSDGRTNEWWQSGHAVAAHAQQEWVRMVSVPSAGHYTSKPAKVAKGEPKWPEKSFEELLNMAFADGRLIDSLDHPVIRKLNGEA